jgi:hypothetical protein
VVLTAKPSAVVVPSAKPQTTAPNNAAKAPAKADEAAKTK